VWRYLCVHCLRELLQLEDGSVEHCPDHPDGSVEVMEADDGL
jgi:hypothetical protein